MTGSLKGLPLHPSIGPSKPLIRRCPPLLIVNTVGNCGVYFGVGRFDRDHFVTDDGYNARPLWGTLKGSQKYKPNPT
jgi:hypothetical protein